MPDLFRSGIRRGPKFEITFEMAVANIKAVAQRLGVTVLSRRLYCQHGSYHSRNLTKKWTWRTLCAATGILSIGRSGRPRMARRICMECDRRQTVGRHCRTCRRQIVKLARFQD